MKISTFFYLLGTILFVVAALALAKEVPVVDFGLASIGTGLTLGSIGN